MGGEKRERERRWTAATRPEIADGLYAIREWVCMMQSRRGLPGGMDPCSPHHSFGNPEPPGADLTAPVRNDESLFLSSHPRPVARIGRAWEFEQRLLLLWLNSGSPGVFLYGRFAVFGACKYSLKRRRAQSVLDRRCVDTFSARYQRTSQQTILPSCVIGLSAIRT